VDRKANTAVVDEIDLENLLKKGDMSANVALNPGDVVFIPNKKRPLQLQDVFGFLSGIAIVDSAVRVITGNRYR
jgi:protein involved in polysaccharide export with SLBB domain